MSYVLPILIAREDVVFPGTEKELDVGREFSINSINAAIDHFSSNIFVVPQKDSEMESPKDSDIYEIGCVCRVEIIGSEPDGCLKVKLEGFHRASLVKFQKMPHPYKKGAEFWGGTVSPIKDIVANESKCRQKLKDFLENPSSTFIFSLDEVNGMLEALKSPNCHLPTIVDKLAHLWPKNNINSQKLKIDILQEKSLYKRLNLLEKAEFITDEQREAIDQKISKKVTKNINKQQKEFYLREKLKVIKEELGEGASKENETYKFRERLQKGSFPDHVRTKIEEEINRFELCSPYSNESTVIRSYLDWLFAIPWFESSKDEKDFVKIKKVLDKHHFGLEKVKERILEFIAVNRRVKENKGTIICFVGPPGVGKTSLAQSIAKALKKEYVKISLGGLYDEAEIRGHRRTYVASLPGRIVRGLRKANVNNPLFLLDEIDKVSNGYHGDPINALLEVLDPKQNKKFNDHYIEEDIDLSGVMFIATANYKENIPDALLDRMEIIHLSSYTDREKFDIARSNLIDEVLEEHGLKSSELSFTDEAIMLIIQKYTMESGVRDLKQKISKIARKFVKRNTMKELESEVITPERVKHYLEYEIYDFTRRDEESIPGIVNGMAYTDVGGDLLPIEVNHMAGKGNISLTGNLRDTMKESASVALAYVRANEDKFNLKDKNLDWNNIDINLHVPSGGIPKDGPSAGVTITTALISSISGKAVSSRIAMTGEITLRGKVLPIGGLKEKVISSVRGGVDVIFYPEENKKHLVDIPDEIKKKIDLIPVKHYTEIYDRIFEKGLK